MMRHPTDENILLLAHGELSAWRVLPLQIHLRRCLRCQARYADFARTSTALAAALRDPNAPPWQPAAPARNLRLLLAAFAALILLTGALGGAFYLLARSNNQRPSTPTHQARPSEGCAPGLPGDRCR